MSLSAFNTPPNILTDYNDWEAWANSRRNDFVSACPSSRSTTYYLSYTGSAGGAGTEADPIGTWAEFVALAGTGGAGSDVRYRFKRGDEWPLDIDDTLDIVDDDITIDAYGDGADPIPLFNRFFVKYLDADDAWGNNTGNRWDLSESTDIAFVRLTDFRLSRPLARVADAATCSTTDDSFFYDNTGTTLYINLGGDDPNDFDIEAVESHGDSTTRDCIFRVLSDGCRLEDLRGDGSGMHRTTLSTQTEAFQFSGTSNDCCYFKGLEAYYGQTHLITQNTAGGGSGGRLYVQNCVVGYGMANDTNGVSQLNFYSDGGGQESWADGCEARYGQLVSPGWTSSGTDVYGSRLVFGHTSGSDIGLLVVKDCTVTSNTNRAAQIGYGANIPTSTIDDLTTVRVFFVNNTQEASTVSYAPNNQFTINSDAVYYGNQYHMWPTGDGYMGSVSFPVRSYIANCRFEINYSGFSNSNNIHYGFYNGSSFPPDASIRWYHNYIRLFNFTQTSLRKWAIDFDMVYGTLSTIAKGAGSSGDSLFFNNILVKDGGGSGEAFLGLTNTSTALKNNAFYAITDDTNYENGYSDGTAEVVLGSTVVFGVSDDDLLEVGTADILLSHDINGKKRRVATPDIGPVDFSSPIGGSQISMGPQLSTQLSTKFSPASHPAA